MTYFNISNTFPSKSAGSLISITPYIQDQIVDQPATLNSFHFNQLILSALHIFLKALWSDQIIFYGPDSIKLNERTSKDLKPADNKHTWLWLLQYKFNVCVWEIAKRTFAGDISQIYPAAA